MGNNVFQKICTEYSRKSGIYVYIIMMVAILANCFMLPKYLPQQIFALIFLGVLIYGFREGNKKAIYYSTLLFSIVNYYMVLPINDRINIYYFYITLMVYYIIIFFDILKNWSGIRNIKIKVNRYNAFVLVFIAYSIISIIWASDKIAAVKQLEIYFIMFLYAWMIFNENRSKQEVLKTIDFVGFIFIGIIIMGLLKILGFNVESRNVYTDKNYYSTQLKFLYYIPCSFFYNPNNYGVFLSMGLIGTSIKSFFEKDKRKKIIYVGVYLLAVINLIFTMSRTAWISLFIMLIGLFIVGLIIRNSKMIRHAGKYIIFTFIIFFVMSMVPAMRPYYGKLNSTHIVYKVAKVLHIKINTNTNIKLDNDISIGGKGSDSERVTLIYNVCSGVIKEKHYMGFGTGNIEKYIQTLNNTYQISNIHNMWFEVLGNFGVGIFVYFIFIYLSLMISMLLKLRKSKNEFIQYINLTFLIIMGGYIFLSFAPSTVIAFIPHWFIFAITFLIVNVYNKMEENI